MHSKFKSLIWPPYICSNCNQLHIIIWLTVFVLELLKWYFFKMSGYTFAFKKHLRSLWISKWYEVKKSLFIVLAKTETKKLQKKYPQNKNLPESSKSNYEYTLFLKLNSENSGLFQVGNSNPLNRLPIQERIFLLQK